MTESRRPPLADPDNPGASGLRDDPILSIETVNAARVVRLRGELDLYNSARVREGLSDACAGDPERLVVDLTQVDFIDSTALGALIEVSRRLRDRRALVLAAPGPEALRALEISGLDHHFTVLESVQAGLDAEL
jgi:anti-sigma B factor antagonist